MSPPSSQLEKRDPSESRDSDPEDPRQIPVGHSGTEEGADAEDEGSPVELLELTIHFRGKPNTLHVPTTLTVSQLSSAITESLSIDTSKQKIMVAPKPGILKHPFPDTPLRALLTPRTKITLFGSTDKEVYDLNNSMTAGRLRTAARTPTVRASPRRDWKKIQEESTYTFHSIQPLPYLPNPERSQRFLERLANDPGIKTAMRIHKFSVGLLTEMNPAEHTTQESRTLGLNRNRGEVIELRLRTDRYDGYRDYRVIRKTLCHELSHNVWGDHDRNFWDLTKQIEQEVERADWKHGGHQLAQGEFYDPEDHGIGDEHLDSGGWVGGEFILGSDRTSNNEGLSRREIMARAAMNRLAKQKQLQAMEKEQEGQSSTSEGGEDRKPTGSS